jgi:(E)-4-hydroxy-3-methyl-but-2-enyl pyrophosphate reductase
MDVRTAQVGFCFGIERAYSAFDKHARTGERIHVAHRAGGAWDTLRRIERGDPQLLDRYPALRNVAVTHDVATLKDGDRLVLGFHGLAEDTKTTLANRGVGLVEDMLCPFIAKLDRVVEQAAGDGFDIAIVGRKGNHHCNVAEAMAQQHGQRCYVIESPEDLDTIPKDGRRVALVGQVTGNTVTFDAVIDRVEREKMPVRIFRTMCGDSRTRQENAVALARTSDVVILVNDGGGASDSVYEVCSRHNARIHKVGAKEDLRHEWFDGAKSACVVGGILVPEWTIEEIAQGIRDLTA